MKKKALVPIFFFSGLLCSTAQTRDSSARNSHLAGSIGITNNGISLIPSFSLGKPAAIFNMYAGGKRFSFDPELTFSLEGRPWYFLFWLRYKLVNNGKFRMSAGTHLGLNYKTMMISINQDTMKTQLVERYLVGELNPTYSITENFSIGIYYLYSKGLDATTKKNTNFITLNTTISNIRLTGKYFFRLTPQLYYLNQEGDDGFYFTSALSISRKNFPVSISSVINKAIQTEIAAGKDFSWNLALTYSFSKN